MDIKRQYNEIGKQYIDGKKSFFLKKENWRAIATAKHLGNIQDKNILDIGCGDGGDYKIFESMGAKVFGIDPSELMVEHAKNNVQGPENIQVGDYENIPFPDKSFDIVFGCFSLHYLDNFDKAYEEMHRVLVHGGKLLLIVSHPSFDLTWRLEEKNKDKDLITIELYDNKTKVSFPPHILRDYFSPTFLKLFNIMGLDEYSEEELKKKEAKVPGALLYYAEAK
jgi:SAM-dependent methyltransferase